MDIREDIQALNQIGIGMRIADSEGGNLRGFHSLAQIESERGIAIGITARQRNVLQVIERLGTQRRIGEHGPVFPPTIQLNFRSLMPARSARGIGVVGPASRRAEVDYCRRQERDPSCSRARIGATLVRVAKGSGPESNRSMCTAWPADR